MIIRNLKLKNFKAFGEAVDIPIRRITLIYGQNSSGKSSLIQSLVLLKQSLEGHGQRQQGLMASSVNTAATLVNHTFSNCATCHYSTAG